MLCYSILCYSRLGYSIPVLLAILAQGCAVHPHPCKSQGWQPLLGGLCLVGGQSWPRCCCAPRADSPFHLLMPMAPQTEHEDMTVVAISLAHTGAFRSIGNALPRASSFVHQCFLRRPCFALHDAQALAPAFACVVGVMLGAFFCLIVVLVDVDLAG